MTEQTNAAEPTMEEILASIRRIISEDDAPAETAAPADASAEPAPVAAEPASEPSPALMDETPSVQDAPQEDVLELTEPAEAAAPDVDPFPVDPVSESAFTPEAEPHTPEHPSIPAPAAAPASYDTLVGDSAAASAASAFAGLTASLKKDEPPVRASGPDLNFASGSTVEAMVAEMLRPMLKDWLDANLPGIVEIQVRKEVERIARSAG